MQWWLLAVLVCGCNAIYGLDETNLAPPIFDQDGDGIADTADNCHLIANADQRDDDDDSLGNACDLCPTNASANHDEDRDRMGDECDLCPTTANFELDNDRDGIGDDCDNDQATKNSLVVFDPFVEISDAWEPTTVPWIASADAAEPIAVDTRLVHKTARVVGTKQLWIEIGLGSREPWKAGDHFGVELLDATTDEVLVACRVSCGANCIFARFPRTVEPSDPPPNASTVPSVTLRFNHTIFLSACVLGEQGTVDSDTKIDFGEVKLALVGSPHVHVRYVMMWQ